MDATSWEADLVAALSGRSASANWENRSALNSKTNDRRSLRHGLTRQSFPDFGLYVYRSSRLYLAIRCGGRGWITYCGHAHEDQLAIEMSFDGIDVIRDPGTFLYTPDPGMRNQYRSRNAHFVPHSTQSATRSRQLTDLFALPQPTPAECRKFDDHGFEGRLIEDDVRRGIEFFDDCVRIVDEDLGTGRTREYLFLADGVPASPKAGLPMPHSPGYGWQCRDAGDLGQVDVATVGEAGLTRHSRRRPHESPSVFK